MQHDQSHIYQHKNAYLYKMAFLVEFKYFALLVRPGSVIYVNREEDGFNCSTRRMITFLINNNVVQYCVCLFVCCFLREPTCWSQAALVETGSRAGRNQSSLGRSNVSFFFFSCYIVHYSHTNISLLPFSRIGWYSIMLVWQHKMKQNFKYCHNFNSLLNLAIKIPKKHGILQVWEHFNQAQ